MPTLYDYLDSGNGYKIRLLLALLQQPYRWVELDILSGGTRTPQFLAKNLNGRIPTLELDDGTFIAESNAILWYLAEGTPFLPEDRLGRAQVLQWMFFEQYSHEPYRGDTALHRETPACRLAAPRGIAQAPGAGPRRARRDGIASAKPALFRRRTLHDRGHRALCVHACSPRSAFRSRAISGNVRSWLARVAGQPRHIPITYRPPG